MKKLIAIPFLLLCVFCAIAQSPQAIPYQAVLRNADGSVMANQAVTITFTIHNNAVDGTTEYQENHNTTSNALGLINLNVGQGTPSVGTFNAINWGSGTKFLQVAMNSGNGNIDLGTQQMLSVPYALYAVQSGNCFNHYIGEIFGGGVIFHLWKDEQGIEHGLIVDKVDLSAATAWSNLNNSLIGNSAQSSWDGRSNSLAIVDQAGHTNSAASLCLNSTHDGWDDWYLPSIDEFKILWQIRFNINKTLSNMSGAVPLPNSANYWTSTENSSDRAWHHYGYIGYGFDNNYYVNYAKSTTNAVRAIRSF